MPNIENIITAKEFSLQDILSNKKYSVDFFQREYSWEKENMVQLVYDLTNAFYENYHTGDTPESIDNYNSYYMCFFAIGFTKNLHQNSNKFADGIPGNLHLQIC